MRKSLNRERRQFRVLNRAFLARVVDLELLSADADTSRLLAQFAALFAGISYLFTFWLIFAGRAQFSRDFLYVMEHLLIATTMVVVGLFSVLCWDSVFPDRRDVLVLAPLPVGIGTIFRAKLAALIAALCVSVLALNVISGLVWPRMFSITNGGGYLGIFHSLAAYWVTMLLAAAFMFGCVLGVQGVASLLLPRQKFLRLSALLQVAAFFLFVGVYILEPSIEAPRALTAPENQRLLAWLPSYWFLGLFQQLNGSMVPAFAPLAKRAWAALAVAVFAGMSSVLMAYLRTMGKIVEEPDITPGIHHAERSPRFGTLLETSIVAFSIRTLLRSRQHRVLLSFYLGAGLALVLAYVKTPLGQQRFLHGATTGAVDVSFLVASFWMICFAILGVRLVLSMPHQLRANWIFRMTETREVAAYMAAIRRSLLLLGLAPVWLVLVVLFLSHWPTWPIVGHLVLLGLVGIAVVEFSLRGFHKLPFTCSWLPGQSKVYVAFWSALLVLAPLVLARYEKGILNHPLDFAGMIASVALVAGGARWLTTTSAKSSTELIFEEEYPPELFSLNLAKIASPPLNISATPENVQK